MSKKNYNFTALPNDVKRIFLSEDNDLDYGDLAVYVYISMFIQVGENGRDGKPNGKQGYCYKTKVAMSDELAISRGKLDKAIERLIEYGFVETREVANRYGGRPLLEYRLSTKWKALL